MSSIKKGYIATTKGYEGYLGKKEFRFSSEDLSDARHWVINHLDCSCEWDLKEITVYRIYGKHKDDKKYSALGSDGLIGSGNLIYAYFFEIISEEDMVKLDANVEKLNKDNPEYKFEKRKV